MKRPIIKEHKILNTGDVFISWTKCDEAQKYIIKKSEDENGEFINVARVDSDVLEVVDSDVQPQKLYWYKVIAYKKQGEETDLKRGKLSSIYTLVQDKMQLIELITHSDASVELKWQSFENVDGYAVFKRNEHASKPVLVMSVDKEFKEYKDTSSILGTVNYYSVRAYNIVNGTRVYVAQSQELVSISVGKANIIKCKKTLFGKLIFNLSIVSGASGYIIKQKMANGEFEEIIRTDSNTQIELEYKPQSNAPLTFVVVSYKVVGDTILYSEPSEEINAK